MLVGHYKNVASEVFGNWTAIELAGWVTEARGIRRARWRSRCICGAKRDLTLKQLRSGSPLSCGCVRPKLRAKSGRFTDLAGQKFGNWSVINRTGSRRKPNGADALWRCRCVCGNEQVLDTYCVKRGRPASCGCKRGAHRHSAGGKISAVYSAWKNMVARCTQPSYPSFEQYRGRGITICERWRTFQNFLDDMGERPSAAHSIDRIDNDGNYEPGNVRWATKQEQANNRATNVLVHYRGRDFTLAELARETGVSKEIIRSRLRRSKKQWTVEGALSLPPQAGDKSIVAR